MQYDVVAKYLSASGQVSASGQTGRLKGIYVVPGASAGSVIFKNGGSSGTALVQVDTVASATSAPVYIQVPGEGVRFTADIYATISNATSVTAFWG